MGRSFKTLLGIVVALALCTGLAGVVPAADKPKRGDYPRCQDECVVQLKTNMRISSDDYQKTGNRLLYEQRVEQARGAYDTCIDMCRERYPVK